MNFDDRMGNDRRRDAGGVGWKGGPLWASSSLAPATFDEPRGTLSAPGEQDAHKGPRLTSTPPASLRLGACRTTFLVFSHSVVKDHQGLDMWRGCMKKV